MVRTLSIKAFYDETHYLQVFYNIFIGISMAQIIIYPLFLWEEFWFINVSQMLFVVSVVCYILFNMLSLNQIGVYLRIFARMVFVVVVFGCVSVFIILVVAYPIHTGFVTFSQPILGQLYKDLNLFDTLYQGVLTCFEFVFGAVVLVRPYVEENAYTYAMTFIMTMFAFFGNIMLANMLVAFLTSQFEHITRNAKYLTMNMQFGLIKVFKTSNVDTLVSLPFWLILPALPLYSLMTNDDERRVRVNLFLRKVIHVVNIFLPTLIVMTIYLIIMMAIRYLQYIAHLFMHSFVQIKNLGYLAAWIVGGPFLLLKLFILDIKTLFSIILDFSKPPCTLLDFELSQHARENLIKIFHKFNRVL